MDQRSQVVTLGRPFKLCTAFPPEGAMAQAGPLDAVAQSHQENLSQLM